MKSKIISILALTLLMSMGAKAQVYTCEQLQEDIKSWNQLKSGNNNKWANAIKDKGIKLSQSVVLYKMPQITPKLRFQRHDVEYRL